LLLIALARIFLSIGSPDSLVGEAFTLVLERVNSNQFNRAIGLVSPGILHDTTAEWLPKDSGLVCLGGPVTIGLRWRVSPLPHLP
jgi:hypothetical protein